MKTTAYILLALFSTILFSACDDEVTDQYKEEVVVQGFLWVGQRMEIALTHTVPMEQAYYADSVKVTGAEVYVSVDGETYPLTEVVSGEPGTYAAQESDHVVTPGKRYDLLVVVHGDTLRAHATAAGALDITDAFLINDDGQITDTNPDTLEYNGDGLVLAWTTDTLNFGYAIFTESMETGKYGEACDFGEDNGPGTYLGLWTTRGINYQVMPWIQFCYTGPTQFRVFSCDSAWWDFSNHIIIGGLNNDPVSNIEGGKGVFCAVDCDTFLVTVTDSIPD